MSRPSAADVVICAFWAFGPHPLILSFPFPSLSKEKKIDDTLITKDLYAFFSHYASLSLYLTHNSLFQLQIKRLQPTTPTTYTHAPPLPFFFSGFLLYLHKRSVFDERAQLGDDERGIHCLLACDLPYLPYLTSPHLGYLTFPLPQLDLNRGFDFKQPDIRSIYTARSLHG